METPIYGGTAIIRGVVRLPFNLFTTCLICRILCTGKYLSTDEKVKCLVLIMDRQLSAHLQTAYPTFPSNL
ncbi:unnamed protein product [Victoria cruziana]